MRQVLKFIAVLAECLPEMAAEVIQGWIENPTGLKKVLKSALCPPDEIVVDPRVLVLNHNTLCVNLDALPKLPLQDVTESTNRRGGWAIVQKRDDGDLYVNDRKVILYRSHLQGGDTAIRGHDLHVELAGIDVLHPNILDALMEHKHLIPEYWKQGDDGKSILIHFWGVTFCISAGGVCVRTLCWDADADAWADHYISWLSVDFKDYYPAAALEKN
ncbi:MAG: hypothetical protein KBB55_04050 [Candidatus Buchananbacteria bacterium]|nr:hypothetical protein [Candidatus Buchananbacteria bacterium]